MNTSLLRFKSLVWILLALQQCTINALDNGLGQTPAMGWNSWNLYGCNINETIVKRMADAMVSSGLRDLGYVYVNIDDCWQKSRDALGRIVPDAEKFPSGMKALADYIHSKGLKFGLYSSAGTMTCEKRPGSLGYELIDAQTYASWEVDFLKYDNCFNKFGLTRKNNIDRYTKMRDALNATGRPIYYAMCNWGQSASWEWAGDIANSYRTTGDIGDLFNGYSKRCPCTNKNCWLINYFDIGASQCSVTNILDKQIDIAHYSKPGAFNDMDMLEVGNGGMTIEEYKSHFSLWAALKSPLILGNDLSSMKPEIAAILKNKNLIDINQDSLGKAVELVDRSTDYSWKFLFLHGKKEIIGDVWVGPLANGDSIAILFNRDDKPHAMELNFRKHLKIATNKPVQVKDLWTSKSYLAKEGSVVARRVPAHGVVALRIINVD